MATTASTTTVLDVPSLVSQLMSVERAPITKLEAKISTNESKISSLGTVKGLVSTLQSALGKVSSAFSGYTASSSDAASFSASAGSSAVAGSYTLAISSLARAQSLVAAGQASSTAAVTSGAATVNVTINGTTSEIAIASGASLGNIRDAINAANLGVSASIVNDGSTNEDGSRTPYRLVLTSSKTGTENAITNITVSGDSALDSLLAFGNLTEVTAAADARFTVNGLAITSASNTVTDAIQGVTLTLRNAPATGTLSVERDTTGMKDALTSLVESYNSLVSQLKTLSSYATSSSATSPVLAGDGALRSMLDQLRGILSSGATGGTLSYLSQIGISVQADSSLKFDTAKFDTALADNYADVQNLLNSSSGFITRMNQWATKTLETGGVIDSRVNTIKKTNDNYSNDIEKLEARMKILQAQYTTTYTNLNTYLATMDSLSTYLTSQLAIINNTKSS